MTRLLTALGAVLLLVPCPVPACSLCSSPVRKESLGQELDRAPLIVFGYAANPRLNVQAGALPGSGTTDFHVEKILKNDTKIVNTKLLTLDRYLPVLDAKDPPRFLLFCNLVGGKLDPYLGRQAKSRAVIDYVEGARAERTRGKVAALAYYAKFLDHADPVIAEDAFLEFARSADADVGQAARTLDPVRIRALLRSPALDADRISLFGFLLGSCGSAQDADELRRRVDEAKGDDLRALDGLLGGLICLRPKQGWELTRSILADRAPNFLKKYAALRTVRFFMGWKPAETHADMLAAYRLVIPDGETADLAIEDLRRWKAWDLTSLVLAQYGKSSHDAPIVKRGILRYALSCPAPEAQRFVDDVRVREPDLIRELGKSLDFEKDG